MPTKKTIKPKPAKSLDDIEDKIAKQLDRLHKFIREKRNIEFIKIDYKRYAELGSQKYLLIKQNLEKEKTAMDQTTFKKQTEIINAEYKKDLISIAVAIDEELSTKV